ncbi:hypothetical protein LTR84_005040 [Exophiala bonariae]|uniref:Uncharacterized protein n=1 Tax=Exophiala bonariae TaxID=1690606 RepID=A0AAV9NP09_9EURO|nr:hypothetical protein LTR84_005040 [Exophiala bonariae]
MSDSGTHCQDTPGEVDTRTLTDDPFGEDHERQQQPAQGSVVQGPGPYNYQQHLTHPELQGHHHHLGGVAQEPPQLDVLGALLPPLNLDPFPSPEVMQNPNNDNNYHEQTQQTQQTQQAHREQRPNRRSQSMASHEERQETPNQASSRPTVDSARRGVRLVPPRSRQPLERLPWNTRINPRPVEISRLPDRWLSGCNHFAHFGLGPHDEEPKPEEHSQRLKYPIKLNRTRRKGHDDKGKYVVHRPDGAEIIPAGTSLRQLMTEYPNHSWGEGLRLLMAEGITARELYNYLPDEAKNTSGGARPHNNIQHAFGRELFKMEEEETQTRREPQKRGQSASVEGDETTGEPSTKKRKTGSASTATRASAIGAPPALNLPPLRELRQQESARRDNRGNPTLGQWERGIGPIIPASERYRDGWARRIHKWKSMADEFLLLTDEEYSRQGEQSRLLTVEKYWESITKLYSADIRRNLGIPPTEVHGANVSASFWMRQAVLRSQQGAQREGEPDRWYQERIKQMVYLNLNRWFDTRVYPVLGGLLQDVRQQNYAAYALPPRHIWEAQLQYDPAATGDDEGEEEEPEADAEDDEQGPLTPWRTR